MHYHDIKHIDHTYPSYILVFALHCQPIWGARF